MKERIKKKSFWLAFAGSMILVLQLLGLKIDAPVVNEVVSAVCALLIFLGVMTDDVKPPQIQAPQEPTEPDQQEDNN